MAVAKSQNPGKKRVVIYIRVSTQEQVVEGHSIEAQEVRSREYAERMGYEVVEVYIDEGLSGKSTKHRAAYQQMMSDARTGNFDLVVIWKLTRLGRNMLDILNTVEEFIKLDIELFSISENFDISTSSGKLMLQLLSSFSEFERNQISENVIMAMMSLVRDQQRYAGGRRLGYVSGFDAEGRKQLIIEPEEAKIVQLIYAKFLGGDEFRTITNYLNRQGYQTLKKNKFTPTAVRDILQNKIYAGYIEYARYLNWDTKRRKGKNPNPILVKGEHEPIIDQVTYQAVQDRLLLEKDRPRWNLTGENVLTGLLRCPECGAPMAANNVTNTLKDGTKKTLHYYSCSEFLSKGATKGCHANSIRKEKAEEFVAARLKEIVQVPEILDSLVKEMNRELHEQIAPLEQELAVVATEKLDLKPKLDRLQQALEDSPELHDSLIDRINELTSKIMLHTQRENEILTILSHKDKKIEVENVQQIISSLDHLLAHSEKKVAKEIYRTFIDKILFDKKNKDDIKIYMKFDQTIVTQLNEIYQKVVSDKRDTTSFLLQTPFYSVI
ncbi:recombinase family protein [Enterococcus hulanensis]|uniref:recombinase family protein n=1 Tax=Enterococcus hulanensis TaxID=2559929 RepID=UPI00288DDB4D|nr:recombinase family protein [Enterococcus hulanensis]MDT2659244.1 recombinase family protein [Enterococcus hulanensis]